MRFSNSFLDELRDRVNISDVVGRRVTWDRKKSNASKGDYWACCPFHGERSPSFHCEDRKGRYHCFGCGVSGDHFRFLTELDGMAFPEAVRQIADMAGVSMPQPDVHAERRERERSTLEDVMEMATTFFQSQLQSAAGAKARAYLRDRGLTGRTIETFRLGFAPDSRNALKEHLASTGITKEQMEACGLVVHENVPVSYDRFRDRIMFPILSAREKVIAFGGRAMASDATAKYLNSNETDLFHKGNVLYNYARARRSVQSAGTVIAVEGYMDVIALHQVGIENAVAPLGTALTESQLKLLWKMAPQPILCFDGDEAGVRAANRASDLALPLVGAGRSVGFALLPEGKDPDDMVRHVGRSPFDKVINEAEPLAAMIWKRETSAAAFDTPEKRAALESRLKQIVSSINDESVRRFYQQDMRSRLNAFFQPQGHRGGYAQAERGSQPKGDDGKGRGIALPSGVSDRLARSGLVKGYLSAPPLRESVLALTLINHPGLLQEEYDEIAAIEFDNADLKRLWPMLLTELSANPTGITRAGLMSALAATGYGDIVKSMDQQVRNSGVWTATEDSAQEDAREGMSQALALHQRTRSLRRQKSELERELADCTESGDADRVGPLMRALAEVQLEVSRLENQDAIIDGFGVLSGRVKASVPVRR